MGVGDTYESLLPPSASKLEHVLAEAGKRMQGVPVPIDVVKRPHEVPVQYLPHLAYEFSTDIWERTWPEVQKRSVVNAAIPLQRIKGTERCLREYIRYVGGEVVSVVRPPQRVFSGPSITPQAREAWLAGLPQVRTWTAQETGFASPLKMFCGSRSSNAQPLFREGRFTIPSTALSRLHRRARWVVFGVETNITVTNFGTWFRLHLASTAGLKLFSGDRPRVQRFYIPSDAWRRLITIRPTPSLPWRVAVTPSLQAVKAKADRIAEVSTAGLRVIGYRPPYRRFFIPSTASSRLYDRYAVFDGTSPVRRRPVQFMGTGRYGFPAHTAEVAVRVNARRHRLAAGAGFSARRRFWMPRDPEPLDRVLRAAQAAKRLSDRVLLNIGPRPRFVAGRPFMAGTDRLVVGTP